MEWITEVYKGSLHFIILWLICSSKRLQMKELCSNDNVSVPVIYYIPMHLYTSCTTTKLQHLSHSAALEGVETAAWISVLHSLYILLRMFCSSVAALYLKAVDKSGKTTAAFCLKFLLCLASEIKSWIRTGLRLSNNELSFTEELPIACCCSRLWSIPETQNIV